MLGSLIDLVFSFFEYLISHVIQLQILLIAFGNYMEVIVAVMFACLPELLVVTLFLSIGFIIVLKVIQFH